MSEDQQFNPQAPAADQSQQPPEKWIHPDTLKFMGMAKNLLESPEIKHSIAAEQQKQAKSTPQEDPVNSTDAETDPFKPGSPQIDAQSSPLSEDQPDTLNFRDMARDLLTNRAQQSTEAES